MAEALRRLGEAIHAGRDDLAVSGDLTAQIVLRQRLVEAQSRMMRDLHHMLGLDHVFALIDAVAALVAAGFFGASFPMVIAHGRAFFPPHLMGRGVTLLNLFGIAPVGLAQIVTGWVHAATPATTPAAPYAAVFLFFAVTTAAGLAVYLLSQDRTD